MAKNPAPKETAPDEPSQAMITVEPQSSQALIMADAINVAREQRSLLSSFVKEQMVEGTDFGVIPGTRKPTLYKAGAEKMVDLYRCEPSFRVMERIVDFDKGLFHYEIRCRLIGRDSGKKLAEGLGSCNSMEARYRWRTVSSACPTCGVVGSVIPGKKEFGGGWLCWKKKGGCGDKFSAFSGADQRVENDDPFTLANTILKMAKKRSLVDAAIALARCSDIFTQDVEDIADAIAPVVTPPRTRMPPSREPGEDDDNLPGDFWPPPPRDDNTLSPDVAAASLVVRGTLLASIHDMVVEADTDRWREVVTAANESKNSGAITPDDWKVVRESLEAARPILFEGGKK